MDCAFFIINLYGENMFYKACLKLSNLIVGVFVAMVCTVGVFFLQMLGLLAMVLIGGYSIKIADSGLISYFFVLFAVLLMFAIWVFIAVRLNSLRFNELDAPAK